jgi:hypothetical protein
MGELLTSHSQLILGLSKHIENLICHALFRGNENPPTHTLLVF